MKVDGSGIYNFLDTEKTEKKEDDGNELKELAKVLEEKFQRADRVFVFNIPDHLKDLFKDTFGTYVEKSTFKEWVQEHNLNLSLSFPEGDDGEKLGKGKFPDSAEAGTAKTALESFPLVKGKILKLF